MFLHALAQGSCARLHSIENLSLPVNNDDDSDAEDEEETRHYMEALADMLEQRQALGSCVGMKKLGGPWLSHGPIALRERILRTVLPTLEELPDCEEWPETLSETFFQVGAPSLLQLKVLDTQLLWGISTRPDALDGLLNLSIKYSFERRSLDDIRLFAKALAEGAWPKLQLLLFDHVQLGRESFQVLLNGLVARLKTQAKPLQGLALCGGGLTDEDVDATRKTVLGDA